MAGTDDIRHFDGYSSEISFEHEAVDICKTQNKT